VSFDNACGHVNTRGGQVKKVIANRVYNVDVRSGGFRGYRVLRHLGSDRAPDR
jgi:hypothetical protein